MRLIASIVIAALLLTTTPLGAEPQGNAPTQPTANPEVGAKIVLKAPSTAKVGELVRFDASESRAASFSWKMLPENPDFEVYAEGRKAVFSARKSGTYTFVVAAAQGDTVDSVIFTLTVDGPPTQPTSDRLAEWIPFWLQEYNHPKEQKEALAKSFEQVALKCVELKTPEAIIKATAEANRAALGENLQAWIPFLQKLQAAMQKYAAAGTLTTPEQHSALWIEIATALRKA